MKVSVIVPTYNRADQLTNLLKALEGQTYKDFETIVVNDGSTDNTLDTIGGFIRKTTLKLKIYSIPNVGRAASRNYGIEKSNGDLIIFFDDDTRPNTEAVLNHFECHLKLAKVLVSGPYLYDHSKFLNDFSYFRQWMELKWIVKSDDIIESRNLRINGGNFSMKKKDLLLVGGFDERLRDKEDFKLSFDFKMKCKGDVLYFYPTWVYHDDFRGLFGYIEREKASRREEQKLPQIEPEIGILFPERFIVQIPKGIKYQVGRIFRIKAFIVFCEKVLNMRLINRTLKNKLYDLIITMNIKYL